MRGPTPDSPAARLIAGPVRSSGSGNSSCRIPGDLERIRRLTWVIQPSLSLPATHPAACASLPQQARALRAFCTRPMVSRQPGRSCCNRGASVPGGVEMRPTGRKTLGLGRRLLSTRAPAIFSHQRSAEGRVVWFTGGGVDAGGAARIGGCWGADEFPGGGVAGRATTSRLHE